MANFTPNYNLKKPLPEEFYNIEDHNSNMDIIDAELKNRASLDAEGKVLESQLPEMDYIPTSEKGVAGGVAILDGEGKLPANALPEGGSYISTKEKGVAGGVATLGADKKVPAEQLPEISSAKSSTVTLYTYGWVEGADDRYYQTVNVPDVTADAKIITVDVDLSTDDGDARVAYLEAWAHPSANEVDQGNGTLTFYAWELPTVNIPVNVGVM